MAQHTTTSNFTIISAAPTRISRTRITRGMILVWKIRLMRAMMTPVVWLLLANECLRDRMSGLFSNAATSSYRAGSLALGFYGETRYLVFWTGRSAYVRPVGKFGVLNKCRAGKAKSMFEALLVAQTYLGECQ